MFSILQRPSEICKAATCLGLRFFCCSRCAQCGPYGPALYVHSILHDDVSSPDGEAKGESGRQTSPVQDERCMNSFW